MPDELPVNRVELLEERGNRDAFWLATMILVVFALFLGVLGIVAFNVRVMLMPIVPRATPAPASPTKSFAHLAPVSGLDRPATTPSACVVEAGRPGGRVHLA